MDILNSRATQSTFARDFPRATGEDALPPDDASWEKERASFQHDLQKMIKLVKSRKHDCARRFRMETARTILRQALPASRSQCLSPGQLVDLRRALGAWRGIVALVSRERAGKAGIRINRGVLLPVLPGGKYGGNRPRRSCVIGMPPPAVRLFSSS